MRYLPLTNDDRKNMKKVIGINDINEMFTNVPKEVSLKLPKLVKKSDVKLPKLKKV